MDGGSLTSQVPLCHDLTYGRIGTRADGQPTGPARQTVEPPGEINLGIIIHDKDDRRYQAARQKCLEKAMLHIL